MSNLQTILGALRSWGLTREQAAGVAGNFVVESGLDPTRTNPSEGAIGIAQWEGGRRSALEQYAAQNHASVTDLGTQLGFLRQELQGSQSGAMAKIKATSNASDAAAAFDQYFERSNGKSRATRQKYAQQIASANYTFGDFVSDPLGTLGDATGQAAGDAAKALNPFGDWQTAAIKIGGGLTAAALIVLGAVHTVSN